MMRKIQGFMRMWWGSWRGVLMLSHINIKSYTAVNKKCFYLVHAEMMAS